MVIEIAAAQLDADQPEFGELLTMVSRERVRTVVIKDAKRHALTLAQKVGILALLARDVRLVTARGDDVAKEDDPTHTLALAYGYFEKVRELRVHLSRLGAREARRKAAQDTWREMGTARRASAPQASL